MNTSCCYNCRERMVGCHSKCRQYAAYRKEIEGKKEDYHSTTFRDTLGVGNRNGHTIVNGKVLRTR